MGAQVSSTNGDMLAVQSLSPVAPNDASFRFMDLPPELRAYVYENLVLVGKVFFTPDWYDVHEGRRFNNHSEYRPPSLSILRVCRAIHDEAEAIYLAKNTFVLPPLWNYMQPARAAGEENALCQGKSWLFSKAAFHMVKHISVGICVRTCDVPCTMGRSDWNVCNAKHPKTVGQWTTHQKMKYAHRKAIAWQDLCCRSVSVAIGRFSGLQSLELDFSNAYCPVGCCRRLEVAWSYVLKHAKDIRILGVGIRAERHQVLMDCDIPVWPYKGPPGMRKMVFSV
ncbi:uncharacterized protein M421DRAFT_336784 [Didymella exigua CBS 183.55]|uniref:Uncharacterized protein n=1 Tax=Didymella exigua CBS 183.55 TaxID=1150837 RepID=A0A6A5R6U9_9PLEO|nr:uncharacterized protein M421DRAFT_336784 [Didymella exigua CBS 183.55]KAF1922918.1 hypothetical protein M421DRAFT_336784 [Didymella exigua CBS 183.55]